MGAKMGKLDNLDIKYDVGWILVENKEKLHMWKVYKMILYT